MNITKHFNQINQMQVGYNIALSNLPSYTIQLSNQFGKKCCTVANLVANLGLNGIHQLIDLLFTPDEQAIINYNFDQDKYGVLIHVRDDLDPEDNNYINNNVRHSGM